MAIVGAGASGLLVAAGITSRDPAARIAVFDRRSYDGGAAYGVPRDGFLLNVRAAALGADPDDTGGFLAWARANGHPGLLGHEFLSRALYGDYLRTVGSGLDGVARHTDDVVGAHPRGQGWELRLASGGAVTADSVVVALGNPPPKRLPGDTGEVDGVIADPLAPGALDPIRPDDPVAVVGAGLTAVDLILALTGGGRDRPVDVISRTARFPRVHCERPPHCDSGCNAAPSARGDSYVAALASGGPEDVLRAFRDELEANPRQCWQSVFDQRLRGDLAGLWLRWDDRARRHFAARIAGPYDRLRHRMAPEVARRVDTLAASGAIQSYRGSVQGVSATPDGLVVSLGATGSVGPVRWVLNATGPDMRTSGYGEVVAGLVASGRARPGWGGLGIDVDAIGAVLDAVGMPTPGIYALGPLCRGARWETTAIPEVRTQAAALARILTGDSVPA